MAKVEQAIYCITEPQRNALLKYLLDRPYREVAIAVQFLTNAPTAFVNVEVPDEMVQNKLDEQDSKLDDKEESKQEDTATKESPVLAHV
jgi:hypothetical protein